MSLSEWTKKFEKSEKVKFVATNGQEKVDRISCGSIIFDHIMGGGFAKGRINEVCGLFSGGKTTLALSTAARIQKDEGKAVVYLDSENALEDKYAKQVGVSFNPDKWVKFNNIKDNEIEMLIRSIFSEAKTNNVGLIIIDSISAIVPESLAGENLSEDDRRKGKRAEFWSKLTPFIAEQVHKTQITFLTISQIREKIDIYAKGRNIPQEDKEYTAGGNAFKFFKSLSLRLQSKQKDYKDTVDVLTGEKARIPIGNKVFGRTIKNKTHPPFKQGYAYIVYGKGFDNLRSAIDIFVHNDLIEKSGKFYTFTNEKKEQKRFDGKEKLYAELQKYPDLCNKWLKSLGIVTKYF